MSTEAGRADTRERILRIARDVLRANGPRGLTFDAVARRLGKSKQAVIYWFPTKDALLAETLLPDVAAEAGAARAALRGRRGPEAVRAFVEAVAGFHLEDLDRFRLVYLTPPATSGAADSRPGRIAAPVLADLAASLDGESDARSADAAAIHAAVLGLVLTLVRAEDAGTPPPHDPVDMIESLARRLAGGG
ncbi:TetR/AcrR family transcriptional regulator [Rhodovulum sp. 12E13]|uniref:TetR/AcrR family transcriptional regulator n=1 Tax=Rhodovulum sp. 12E13 TaxID=2203891 RepID=UPI000E19B6D5|nr:TetR/AcrR family transcriptional regulator [Rhodovulum sp. 12E13]RDC71682.1 TetR/AcrR family transcriptional regulator [Rhodovulum sp. 12E13]